MVVSTPMSYIDFAKEISNQLERLEKSFKEVNKKLDQLLSEEYYDEAPDSPNVTSIDDLPDDLEAEIKKKGARVPYHLIESPKDVEAFRKFIYEAKQNGSKFSEFELTFIDAADKNFDDIRISSKHRTILQGVYAKLYTKAWPFKTRMGYMYKYQDYPLVWEWL